jgi:hypothetical protein
MRLLADPGAARAFLRRDVPLWAWPLCTLGSREWPYVRLWVDDGDRPEAGLWTFDHPAWGGSVQAFGAAATLERMLRGVTLPGRAFVRILPVARSLMTGLYRFDWLEPIVRMHVTPDTLIEPPQTRLVVPLGQADAAALAAYARIGYRRHVTLLAGPGSAR